MSNIIEFDTLPSAIAGYARAAGKRGRSLPAGKTIPPIVARCRGVVADQSAVRKYRALCSFEDDGNLPAPYPHVLAAPLHLQLLTHKAFPFALLGAVHVRNVARQLRAIGADELLDLEVSIEGHRDVDAGIEIDMETRIFDALGDRIWESVSTMLIRGKSSGGNKKRSGWTPPDWSRYQEIEGWKAPEDIGRRYGLVAGDVNPIHMHALVAKPFGFKRAIAHGMWSYARSVARVLPAGVERVEMSVSFKRPVYLPSRVELLVREDAAGREYILTNPDRDTVFIEGRVDAVPASSTARSKGAPEPAPAAKKRAVKQAVKRAAKKAAPKKAVRKPAARKTAAGKKATPARKTARKAARKSG